MGGKQKVKYLSMVIFASMLFACGGSSNDESNKDDNEKDTAPPIITQQENKAPVIEIAQDYSVEEQTFVSIDATIVDSDGVVNTVIWMQIGGIEVSLQSNSGSQLNFTAPKLLLADGIRQLAFEVSAIDDDNAQTTERIIVNVNPVDSKPIANAGGDKQGHPREEVSLSCNDSYDVDSEQLNYSWRQVSGISTVITNSEQCEPTLSLPAQEAELSFTLTVTDDDGSIGEDTVKINISNELLPLLEIDDIKYQGAFRLPAYVFGTSSLNFSSGIIAYNDNKDSIFISGHDKQQSIAEFKIPQIVNSVNLDDLNTVEKPLQNFVVILDRPVGRNDENINTITGMLYFDNSLYVNGLQFYSSPQNAKDTTLIINDANDIENSEVKGYYAMEGYTHAAGWMAKLPEEWHQPLGTYLTGFADNYPTRGRFSVGPSAFVFSPEELKPSTETIIPTTKLLDYSLDHPIHSDGFNDSGDNQLWTLLTQGAFGFIVPGTRTYAVFGSSGGHESGLGYKLTREDGTRCHGYCAKDEGDYVNYYWFWDVSELLQVVEGKKAPYEVEPYSYGTFDVPFQFNHFTNKQQFNPIVGGTYDHVNNRLFLSLFRADVTGKYSDSPIIMSYGLEL